MSYQRKSALRAGLKGLYAASAALSLSFILSGCGERFPNPERDEFDKTVLIEEGTGTWCVNCPRAASHIEELLETLPEDSVIVLALHSNAPDTFATAETEARVKRLGMTAFPTLIFDGTEKAPDDQVSTLESMYGEHHSKLGSPLKMDLSASITSDSVIYDISVTVSSKLHGSFDGVLRIALVEDSVPFENEIWDGLSHVVRRLPESTAADNVTFEIGQTYTFHRALARDDSWGFPLTAVVWVEKEDLEVVQSSSSRINSESLKLVK
jgi:thiol-disulfide isomerase/thioredoxin